MIQPPTTNSLTLWNDSGTEEIIITWSVSMIVTLAPIADVSFSNMTFQVVDDDDDDDFASVKPDSASGKGKDNEG